MMKLLRDLFMGVGNTAWDLARIIGGIVAFGFAAAFLWRAFGTADAIDWSDAGTGFAAMLGGVVIIIAGKDVAKAKAVAMTAPPPAPPPGAGE